MGNIFNDFLDEFSIPQQMRRELGFPTKSSDSSDSSDSDNDSSTKSEEEVAVINSQQRDTSRNGQTIAARDDKEAKKKAAWNKKDQETLEAGCKRNKKIENARNKRERKTLDAWREKDNKIKDAWDKMEQNRTSATIAEYRAVCRDANAEYRAVFKEASAEYAVGFKEAEKSFSNTEEKRKHINTDSSSAMDEYAGINASDADVLEAVHTIRQEQKNLLVSGVVKDPQEALEMAFQKINEREKEAFLDYKEKIKSSDKKSQEEQEGLYKKASLAQEIRPIRSFWMNYRFINPCLMSIIQKVQENGWMLSLYFKNNLNYEQNLTAK